MSTAAYGDFLLPPFEMSLSRVERRTLETLACTGPHGVKVKRIVGTGFGNYVSGADIVCASHARIAGRSMFREVHCIRLAVDKDWGCWTVQFIEGRIGRQQVRVIATTEFAEHAFDAVSYLMAQEIFAPEERRDNTTRTKTRYLRAHVERAGENVVRVQGHGAWYYVEALRSERGTEYRLAETRRY